MLPGRIARNLQDLMARLMLIAAILVEREGGRQGLPPPSYPWLRYGLTMIGADGAEVVCWDRRSYSEIDLVFYPRFMVC
jgi:hypothetical protein